MSRFAQTAILPVQVDGLTPLGPFDWWRHGISHGGINGTPLPASVIRDTAALRPQMIRIFLQQFFDIASADGVYDWSRLDPYLEALVETGASIVAAITIKPPFLFPEIDHAVWRPNDVAAWQRLIHALVTRYSVERTWVSHWEVGNETDIGESGGAPFLIPDAEQYTEFYRMTIAPILEAFPGAKVGGPAACWVENEPLPGFVEICRRTGTQLDFVSWHLYSDDPERHAEGVRIGQAMVDGFPEPRPELFITEWARSFPQGERTDGSRMSLSVEDEAFFGHAGATTAAIAVAMLDAGVDWAFYYHLWDQICYPQDFTFFSGPGLANMLRHWNEVPHRFGLFGVNGDPRPQYFVFQMLTQMGDERLVVRSQAGPELTIVAGRDRTGTSVMVVNRAPTVVGDLAIDLALSHLVSGPKRIEVTRIDQTCRWEVSPARLIPVEVRDTWAEASFASQIWAPHQSVTLFRLEDMA